ncbi:MAG: DUF2023 family protein [Paludibacteraceae bacterium]|nr:DUF2023 family protein [Paludibacteraceae bacterium]
MKVLIHHIYEYQKGLRQLVLHTMSAEERELAEQKMKVQGISYYIQEVTERKINVFMGAKECVEVVKQIGNKRLCDYSPEEDFILGSMLGYDKRQQCERYLKKKKEQRINQLRIIA